MIEERKEEEVVAGGKKKEELSKGELDAIRAKYTTIIDKNPAAQYKPKMVGLNPNMRPGAKSSHSKIFPMQGLWSDKKLLKSTNQEMGVSE